MIMGYYWGTTTGLLLEYYMGSAGVLLGLKHYMGTTWVMLGYYWYITGVLLVYYMSPRGEPWGTTGVLKNNYLGTIGGLLGFHCTARELLG